MTGFRHALLYFGGNAEYVAVMGRGLGSGAGHNALDLSPRYLGSVREFLGEFDGRTA